MPRGAAMPRLPLPMMYVKCIKPEWVDDIVNALLCTGSKRRRRSGNYSLYVRPCLSPDVCHLLIGWLMLSSVTHVTLGLFAAWFLFDRFLFCQKLAVFGHA